MKKIILNQKSYLLYNEIIEFKKEFDKIKQDNYELILFPQIVYLPLFKDTGYKIGSQNFYCSTTSSYTGEVNLETLKSLGTTYTLIAHYERQKLVGETKESSREKLFRSLNAKFNTVLCIGEKRKTDKPFTYIKRDLNYYLKTIEKKNLKYLSIVYEPNWAIGTGDIQCIKKIEKTVNKIKSYVKNKYNTNIEVYYGGSIDSGNAKEILDVCDGILLGKISSNIKELQELLNTLN